MPRQKRSPSSMNRGTSSSSSSSSEERAKTKKMRGKGFTSEGDDSAHETKNNNQRELKDLRVNLEKLAPMKGLNPISKVKAQLQEEEITQSLKGTPTEPAMEKLLARLDKNVVNKKYSTRKEIESLSCSDLGIHIGMDFQLMHAKTTKFINPDAPRFRHIEVQDGETVSICTFFPDTKDDHAVKIIEYTKLHDALKNKILASNGFPIKEDK